MVDLSSISMSSLFVYLALEAGFCEVFPGSAACVLLQSCPSKPPWNAWSDFICRLRGSIVEQAAYSICNICWRMFVVVSRELQ